MTRVSGVVISAIPSSSEYGGSIGEIEVGRRVYLWAASEVYRNGSHLKVGSRVTFQVVGECYATNIDQVDKDPL